MTAIKTVKLTSEQEKKWTQTIASLLWHCPAFAHVLISLLDTVGSKHIAAFTNDESVCPIAATDGHSIIINTTGYFDQALPARVMILAHEICHCIMDHMAALHKFARVGKVVYPDGLALTWSHEAANAAMDYIINDMLMRSKVGQMPQKDGKQLGLHDPKIATYEDSWLDAYRKIYEENPGSCGGVPGSGDSVGSGAKGGFDKHLPPGTSNGQYPQEAIDARNNKEWAAEVASAVHSAKLQGKLPAEMERMFGEILNPQIAWEDKLQALVARKIGGGGWDWRRPDRRLITRKDIIIAPGRSGYGCELVVVGGDTSGSISYGKMPNGEPSEGDMFFAELGGILSDLRPRRLVIMWCDAKVHQVDEAEAPEDLNVIRADGVHGGGGGTSFIPVFDAIAEMGLEPDGLIYLTDGYGSFPEKCPSYPVIWGSTTDAEYPFGEVVKIPKVA